LVWGIGFWVWGLGYWAKPPIPNPQSPIPNPHQIKEYFYLKIKLISNKINLKLNNLIYYY
jgi:hypothetical protein